MWNPDFKFYWDLNLKLIYFRELPPKINKLFFHSKSLKKKSGFSKLPKKTQKIYDM